MSFSVLVVNMDELLEMITAGTEKTISTNEECAPAYAILTTLSPIFINNLMVNDDIDDILQRGEEHTVERNSKYEVALAVET
jgi:hypothetical protein